MGNGESLPLYPVRIMQRIESIRSPSPAKIQEENKPTTRGRSDSASSRENGHVQRVGSLSVKQRHRLASRSHSLEHRSINEVTIGRVASDNTRAGSGACLRQQPQPAFKISGDLSPHQIRMIRRMWKSTLRAHNDDEAEVGQRLLQVAFRLETSLAAAFGLRNIPSSALRHNPIFVEHVKALHPTLSYVMAHLPDATAMSRVLQQLGGRLVTCTTVTYKSIYWKVFPQALLETAGADRSCTTDEHDAWAILAAFCVEQMRIGYRIELKLQKHMQKIQMKRQNHAASSTAGESVERH